MNTRHLILGVLLALSSAWTHAQTAAPTPPAAPVAAPDPDEQPAIRPDLREEPQSDAGTTIVGERESPIGLYITPWRNAYAEQDIDRPARLLQVDMSPLDRDVFARQVEYYDALTEAAAAKTAPAAAPVAPSSPAAP